MKKTGHEKSRDTVPLRDAVTTTSTMCSYTVPLSFLLTCSLFYVLGRLPGAYFSYHVSFSRRNFAYYLGNVICKWSADE